jgi:hypothetical protein
MGEKRQEAVIARLTANCWAGLTNQNKLPSYQRSRLTAQAG